MKILVTAKRVPDPEQKAKLRDGALDLTGTNFVLNPFDEYAVETALRLTEKADAGAARCGEVIVLGIGPKELSTQLRSCLAMGADRAVLVVDQDETLDSDQVAHIVHAMYQREKPDLVLLGKQSVDGDNNQVAQLLAGYAGLAQACFACRVIVGDDKRTLTVDREVDGGTETKRLPLPAVVSVDLRIVQARAVQNGETAADYAYAEGPRYASLKGIMQAKKKPLDVIESSSLGLTLSPMVKVLGYQAPAARQGGTKVASVEALVEKLRHEAKVI